MCVCVCSGKRKTQLSETDFDKITTRYEYWEVWSPLCASCLGISVCVCILSLLLLYSATDESMEGKLGVGRDGRRGR